MTVERRFDLFDNLAFSTLDVLDRHIDALQDVIVLVGNGVDERYKLVFADFIGHVLGCWLRNKARILHASTAFCRWLKWVVFRHSVSCGNEKYTVGIMDFSRGIIRFFVVTDLTGDVMESSGCSAGEPFALRVLGDSMLPEFAEGAIIIIDPEGTVRDGCYVMAEHNDEYIFRQLRIVDGKYYLQPLNDLYDTIEIPGQDAIQGVITQQAGKRRKDHKHYGRDES